MAYEREHKRIPAVLDETAIRSIPYYENISVAELELCRNPFTGEWPRLNSHTLSPGDLYMKVLNEEEKRHFAETLGWTDIWFGDEGASGKKLCSPVFYQRIYGRTGPIYESLPYVTCPTAT